MREPTKGPTATDRVVFDRQTTPCAVVLRPSGEVDFTNAHALWANLKAIFEDHQNVVLDLSRLGYMDSGGVKVLLDAHRLFLQKKRGFALANPSRTVSMILEIVGLDEQLPQIKARLEAKTREVLPLAAIVESSSDAIFSKTLDGILLTWNEGAAQLYGYTAAEAIGQPVSILAPADRPDEIPAIMRRLRRGERIKHYETVRVRKDGTRLDVSLTISPVRDDRGVLTVASTVARDITERKRIEAERDRNYHHI